MRKLIAAVVLTATVVTLAPASADAMSICNKLSCKVGR
jgi:hypothetical protein